MGRKRKEKVEEKVQKPVAVLSPGQEYYVREHKDKLDAARMASDLWVDVQVVEDYLKRIKPTNPNFLAKKDGIVMMTGAQSEADDKKAESDRAKQTEPYEQFKHCVAKIDKTKPIVI